MNSPFFVDKASTLAQLEGQLSSARVLPQITVAFADWTEDRERAVRRILDQDWAQGASGRPPPPLIVRSSAAGEDGGAQSLAGHYASVQDVRGPPALAAAIDAVFASYGPEPDGDQKVLIQPMLDRVTASGVATSREVGSGRPYIVVNTSLGGDTTQVTAGRSNETEVCYHFRGALDAPSGRCGPCGNPMGTTSTL